MSDSKLSQKLILRKLIFLLSCWFTESNEYTSRNRTAVAIKQGVPNWNHSINPMSTTLSDLLSNCTIFVDTSLLVEEFLDLGHNSGLLLCPGKWGKTINLQILKTFFEIQVDKQGNEILPKQSTTNYRLFVDGKISRDDGRIEKLENPWLISNNKTVMDRYQGQHPVIYITFKDVIGSNGFIFNNKFRMEIARVYKQHDYMIKVFERNGKASDLREFQGFLMHKNLKNTTESIWFLSKILHRHFRRKVIILIDDYDMPMHGFLQSHQFPEKDMETMLNQIDRFLTQALQINEHLFKALVIGTFKLSKKFIYGWYDYPIYRIAEQPEPIAQYFGLSKKDVQLIFHKLNISDKLAYQARKWYNGYECLFTHQPFYNPVSVSYFLNYRVIGSFWKASAHHREILKRIIGRSYSSAIRTTILGLISNQTLRIHESIQELSPKEINIVRELHLIQTRSSWQVKNLFSYLLKEGYIIKVPGTKSARIPNNHMASLLAAWLITAYKRIFVISEERLFTASSYFYEFITNHGITSEKLQDSISILYKENRNILQKAADTPIETDFDLEKENPTIAILNCIILRLQISTRFTYDVYYNKIKNADIVLYDDVNGHGILIDVTDKRTKHATELIEKYESVSLEFKGIQSMKYISMNMATDRKILISATILTRTSQEKSHSGH